jgi:hypothetical protein
LVKDENLIKVNRVIALDFTRPIRLNINLVTDNGI